MEADENPFVFRVSLALTRTVDAKYHKTAATSAEPAEKKLRIIVTMPESLDKYVHHQGDLFHHPEIAQVVCLQ